jgi:hypothetical protein
MMETIFRYIKMDFNSFSPTNQVLCSLSPTWPQKREKKGCNLKYFLPNRTVNKWKPLQCMVAGEK